MDTRQGGPLLARWATGLTSAVLIVLQSHEAVRSQFISTCKNHCLMFLRHFAPLPRLEPPPRLTRPPSPTMPTPRLPTRARRAVHHHHIPPLPLTLQGLQQPHTAAPPVGGRDVPDEAGRAAEVRQQPVVEGDQGVQP